MQLADNPDAAPSEGLVAELSRAYPYFTLPGSLMLRRRSADLSDSTRAGLMARIALASPGGDTMLRLTDPDGDLLASFYPPEAIDEAAAKTTDSAIDRFLDTYGTPDPREQALLERMIFNPVPDYGAVLEREAADTHTPRPTSDTQDEMMDAFLLERGAITRQEQPLPVPEQPQQSEQLQHQAPSAATHAATDRHRDPAPSAGSSLSESLAKIYIRRRRFDKAYEIISSLQSANPDKSAYFNDQLRFLRKLMLATGQSVPPSTPAQQK